TGVGGRMRIVDQEGVGKEPRQLLDRAVSGDEDTAVQPGVVADRHLRLQVAERSDSHAVADTGFLADCRVVPAFEVVPDRDPCIDDAVAPDYCVPSDPAWRGL